MEEKSKFISGLKRKNIRRSPIKYFSDSEKHCIIKDYITSDYTKSYIWEKYTGRKVGQFQITRWMRKFGYDDSIPTIRPNFASNKNQMKKKNKLEESSESFENLQLKKRIEELEKQLKDAEMKAIAFSTMVDIAEREFKIPIRKKFNTKP